MTKQEKEHEFQVAIGEYGGIITKICYYFASDSEEFKDLRQDVFLNIWNGLEKFRKDSKLSTWIYRVCLNTCISFQRKQKRNKEALSIEDVVDIADNRDSFDMEKYNRMHALIKRLNYQDRALILLWLDEKTYEEISDLMGITKSNVAVRLMRTKEKLIKMGEEWKK